MQALAVYRRLNEAMKKRTSLENVKDVLAVLPPADLLDLRADELEPDMQVEIARQVGRPDRLVVYIHRRGATLVRVSNLRATDVMLPEELDASRL